jgi:glycosyltransferase involved in cell wall biosynthesis
MLPRDKHLGIDGIYPSLNDAIYSANGKYFYKIDSDDFIENNYIEKLVNEAESGDYDWVCGNLKIVNHESRVGELWDYSTWDVSQNGSLLRGWDRGSVLLPHNGIFRVKFLTDNKLMWQSFDYGWGADVRYTIDCVLCSPKVKLISDSHFCWRIHDKNNSHNVVNRIKLVIATKRYYIRRVEPEIYLVRHLELLNRYPKLDARYMSTQYGLIAHDLYLAKTNFMVPSFLQRQETPKEIVDNIHLFDQEILLYAKLSLQFSDLYRDDMDFIVENINKNCKV